MNDLFKINAARISSCYSNIDLVKSEETNLEKAGEGSRGGKVIGHTKSGKPVYEAKSPKDYHDFSAHDHADAGDLHFKEGCNAKDQVQTDYHNTMRDSHHKAHAKKMNPSKKDMDSIEVI